MFDGFDIPILVEKLPRLDLAKPKRISAEIAWLPARFIPCLVLVLVMHDEHLNLGARIHVHDRIAILVQLAFLEILTT